MNPPIPSPVESPAAPARMDKNLGLQDGLKLYYPMLVLAAAIEVLLWGHWNSLAEIASGWDQYKYSNGYLVPLFAGVLLFLWRDEKSPLVGPLAYVGGGLLAAGLLLCAAPWLFSEQTLAALGGTISGGVWHPVGVGLTVAGAVLVIQQPIDFGRVRIADRWIGLGILLAAEALRLLATHRSLNTPERVSFIVALVGVFVMVGGLPVLKWAGWALAFLPFMLPMPAVMDTVSSGLQTVATSASTFLLQTFGIAAVQEGHDIFVGATGASMTVAEACSGLQMLTIFGAMSFAVALLSPHRPMWQRISIVVSAVPIALTVNIVRITVTGVLFTVFPENQEMLRAAVHNVAGWVMMPMALGLMFLEFQILDHLFLTDEEDVVMPVPQSAPPVRRIPPQGNPAVVKAPPPRPAQPAASVRPAPTARPAPPMRQGPPVPRGAQNP